jgi:16S rRNA (guanine527-N7)-methyltransferase
MAKRWADLGSGAGFPGIVLACALAEVPAAQVHLIDSVNRKATFLQEVVTALALPAQVHVERVEAVLPRLAASIEVVTARALAPLAKLLDYGAPALQAGAVGLFMKGQSVNEELAKATESWKLHYELAPSRTDSAGRIVVVRSAQRIVLPRKLR